MDLWFELPVAIVIFALGASVGSFLNVVVYRVPAGLSLLYPPSRCPHCLTRLRRRENVPVLGWLRLKGRCAHCKSPISVRYPLVEAATGILFVLVFWVFGLSWQTIGYWMFLSWLLALSLIDVDTLTLPNPLTQSGLVVGLAFQAIQGALTSSSVAGAASHLLQGVLGAVLGLWLLDVIALVGSMALGQAAMGGGDAKLAALMGAWLGWKYLLLAGFVACAIGAFAGGAAIGLNWLDRRQPMPFGPFLAVGSLLVLFWGEAMLSLYRSVFFPLA
ncbi:prepilin peptidase [Leptolyngbya sp. FACHB-36]|uniref:prepilin peptidase n=1 Tax=Leptolyngbya sp. FACHB-36 TaxID=2692808 RepID=UPI0016817595|nr:A24 family peptidase [Leptolyngbya sp. FACHB-36]MBD2021738.1 prepilin peptidase [Leptolyngbya sp. FACHB-36]